MVPIVLLRLKPCECGFSFNIYIRVARTRGRGHRTKSIFMIKDQIMRQYSETDRSNYKLHHGYGRKRTILSVLTEEKAVIRLLRSNLSTSYWVIFTLIWWAMTGPNFSNRGNGREKTVLSGSNTHRGKWLVSLVVFWERRNNINTVPKGQISDKAQQHRPTEAEEIFGALVGVALLPNNETVHSLSTENETKER